MNEYAEYNGLAHKSLSENREFYMRQSEMTRGGRVPDADEVRESFRDENETRRAA